MWSIWIKCGCLLSFTNWISRLLEGGREHWKSNWQQHSTTLLKSSEVYMRNAESSWICRRRDLIGSQSKHLSSEQRKNAFEKISRWIYGCKEEAKRGRQWKVKTSFASFPESQLSSSLFLTTIHRKKALNFILSVNNSPGHCLSISNMQQILWSWSSLSLSFHRDDCIREK
jgi:hypothetical protein